MTSNAGLHILRNDSWGCGIHEVVGYGHLLQSVDLDIGVVLIVACFCFLTVRERGV